MGELELLQGVVKFSFRHDGGHDGGTLSYLAGIALHSRQKRL